jgi:hypothetical protein
MFVVMECSLAMWDGLDQDEVELGGCRAQPPRFFLASINEVDG